MQPDIKAEAMKDSVELCLDFFRAAVPVPGVKNITTQLGCHFEEVREMIQSLRPAHAHPDAGFFMKQAEDAIHALAEMLKNDSSSLGSIDRVEFIDSVADQMVTAVGSAYMLGMKPLEAFIEVNNSNLSKFDADGNPIFDANLKVMKGPGYFKAQLEQFA